MRDIPGWVGGALGVGALVGAFHLGGRVGATAPSEAAIERPSSTQVASVVPPAPEAALQVQCEPGQRAIVETRAAGAPAIVTCVSEARSVPERATAHALTTPSGQAYAPGVIPVAEAAPVAAVRPAVMTGPTEIYQPRPRRASYERRGEAAPARRSWERSAVVIGSSAAVGATLGGLAKGKKGALIGGIVGGGAATVWDQVTRRRGHEVDRR